MNPARPTRRVFLRLLAALAFLTLPCACSSRKRRRIVCPYPM
jgi:hypothetical protein